MYAIHTGYSHWPPSIWSPFHCLGSPQPYEARPACHCGNWTQQLLPFLPPLQFGHRHTPCALSGRTLLCVHKADLGPLLSGSSGSFSRRGSQGQQQQKWWQWCHVLRVRWGTRPFFGVVQTMFRLPPILVLQVPEHVSEFPSSLIKLFFLFKLAWLVSYPCN